MAFLGALPTRHARLQLWCSSDRGLVWRSPSLAGCFAAFCSEVKRRPQSSGSNQLLRNNISQTGPQCQRDLEVMRNRSVWQSRIVAAITRAWKIGDWDEVLATFKDVEYVADTIVYNAMFLAADRCDRPEDAFMLYEQMKMRINLPKQAATFTPLIRLAGRHRQLERARHFVEEMRNSTVEPNAHTYSALIGAHKAASDTEGAVAAWQEMRQAGVPVDAVVLASIASVLAKTGDLARTEALLAEAAGSVKLGVVHQNCLLDACKRTGDVEAARRILREGSERGITPDIISYTCMLGTLRKGGGMMDEVNGVLGEMRQAGVAPNEFLVEEHMACLLGITNDNSSDRWPLQEVPREDLEAAAKVLRGYHDAGVRFTGLIRILEERLEVALAHDWVKVVRNPPQDLTLPKEYYWDRATGRTQWELPWGVSVEETVSVA